MNSLKQATGTIGAANKDLNVQEISEVLKNFQKEQMKQEMVT